MLLRLSIGSAVYSELDVLHAGAPIGNTRFDLYYDVAPFTSVDDIGETVFTTWAPLLADVMPITCEIAQVHFHDQLAADAVPYYIWNPATNTWGTGIQHLPMACAMYFAKHTASPGGRGRGRCNVRPVHGGILLDGSQGSLVDVTDPSVTAIADQLSQPIITPLGAILLPVVYSRLDETSRRLDVAVPTRKLGINRASRIPF